MKPFKEQFAEFDARRRSAKITARAIANASGIDESSMSHYRRGNTEPRISRWVQLNDTLERLIAERAKALDKLLSERS